jgi:hypothetical protein
MPGSNPLDNVLAEIKTIIERFPTEIRWDINSAILAEPRPFYRLLVLACAFASASIPGGENIRPLCSGVTGGMLLGNYSDAGYLHNPFASVGEAEFSQPDWYGDETQAPVGRKAVLFVSYADELVSVRNAALSNGFQIVGEYALMGA